jgi:preprotein translocase subunit Sss1
VQLEVKEYLKLFSLSLILATIIGVLGYWIMGL